ncbi:MarR family winged helix-turn-helix transcriptional regulator [Bdellovibrio sp.]|uniref:MarR family winged helix-turn-helix transcriptional regulator n=1 Tax=Bdellovibrio TaxID=958 RepID=UPI0032214F74
MKKNQGLTEELQNKIITGLSRVSVALRSDSWEISKKEKLSPTQMQVLTLLEVKKALTVSALSELLGISKASLSDSVIALENKDLVKKVPSAKDQRSTDILLTSKGSKLALRLKDSSHELVQGLRYLNPSEQSELLFLVSKVIKGLQEEGKITPSKMCVSCKFFAANAHNSKEKPHHCNLIDAAFGAGDLRMDCPEHEI